MARAYRARSIALTFVVFSCVGSVVSFASDPVAELRGWLATARDERMELSDQEFAKVELTKVQAAAASDLLWDDYSAHAREAHRQEWDDRKIKLGRLEMKFEFKVFGQKPANGRSLYISMHGGGGTAPRVNDGQWRNQIRLYEPREGVYLAPRAPTDTWNLWHQSHIDAFFQRIILDAVLFEGVDPNRVFLMGYSAGGDGVYQLAPRMADRVAAAAMMAGHPNGVSPLGLRNIGFALYMGGKDAAYNRNKIAGEWKVKLAELQKNDPAGYQHRVVIFPQFGHWMNRQDAEAVPWMAKFTRQPRPNKVVWKQTGVAKDSFYWLAVDSENRKSGTLVTARRDGNRFWIDQVEGIQQLKILLNDQLADLDQDIKVTFDGRDQVAKVKRSVLQLYRSIQSGGDQELIFSAALDVSLARSD